MIENIAKVLVTTGAIGADPTGGKPNLLYYDSILRKLHDNQFHPSGRLTTDGIDDSIKLRPLSDQEWSELTTVGTLRVPKLVFARGKAQILSSSRVTLDALADTLRTQRYYVKIRGVATRRGNQELNKALAGQRAQAAVDYLQQKGIAEERIRAMEPALGDMPSVSFTLGQTPY
jgi:outer membrane protein OmpA-like peptidoglycan-associated protein